MRRFIPVLLVLPFVLPALGCGARQEAREGLSGAAAQACPMLVDGTKVTAADQVGGAAMNFVTYGDVEDLRRRVQNLSGLYQRTQPREGEAVAGSETGLGFMPPADTAVQDIANGARLVFTAAHPNDVNTLRQAVRDEASRMGPGLCPMLPGGT